MGRANLPFGRVINPGVAGQNFAWNTAVNLTGTTGATFFAFGGGDNAGLRIPGGLMGPNGDLIIDFLFSMTNNGNAKTIAMFLGPILPGLTGLSTLINAAVTSQATVVGQMRLTNRNSEQSQIRAPGSASISFGQTTGAVVANTIDTSRDMILMARGTLAAGADFLQLERIAVTTVYRD